MFPNFIIAGAEKSGTSSLAFYLSEHFDVFIPPIKELHFFEDLNNYSKGYDWYEKQFCGWKGEKAVGECTPFYMYDETCARKIKNQFPDMKIIFILRNPVDRAYSNYWHQVRGGKEYLSFEDALKKERKRTIKSRFHSFTYSYLEKGFYSVQIKRFLSLFDRTQLHVVKFEDLKKHPQKLLNSIYHFLEVDVLDSQETISRIKNKSALPRSRRVQFIARKAFKTSVFFRAVAKVNLKCGYTDYPPMGKNTRQSLVNYYLQDIKKLENMVQTDFSSWIQA
jgi:Sulfotransferase domain